MVFLPQRAALFWRLVIGGGSPRGWGKGCPRGDLYMAKKTNFPPGNPGPRQCPGPEPVSRPFFGPPAGPPGVSGLGPVLGKGGALGVFFPRVGVPGPFWGRAGALSPIGEPSWGQRIRGAPLPGPFSGPPGRQGKPRRSLGPRAPLGALLFWKALGAPKNPRPFGAFLSGKGGFYLG
ncbi:MAG: hypothetical protein CM15mP39_05230 [Synechococcus sp.]|nr:MAG: hypothetical protein CM15mP39_05230 [Synechococcus sp.]